MDNESSKQLNGIIPKAGAFKTKGDIDAAIEFWKALVTSRPDDNSKNLYFLPTPARENDRYKQLVIMYFNEKS